MAPPTTAVSNDHLPSKFASIKDLAESNGLASIPSAYHTLADRRDEIVDDSLAASIPVLDFSDLASSDPTLHAHALQQLAKASAEWNFFMVRMSYMRIISHH